MKILMLSVLLMGMCMSAKENNEVVSDVPVTKQSIHQYKVKDLSGKEFDFSSLKGKRFC